MGMDIIESIYRVSKEEIQDVLQAVMARYRELYPDWDISILSLEKAENKNDQLDKAIALLDHMKE